jgi:D-lactate dehydrogenase (cytochrome)
MSINAVRNVSETSNRRDQRAIDATVAALVTKFGNGLVTSRAVCEQHGNTTTWIANEPPDAVVFPQNVDDVQEIVRTCAAQRVPVIAFGTGTSLE